MSVRLSTEVRKKPLVRATLPTGVAFWAAAMIAFLGFAANAAASPLYRIYEVEFGFSAITLTLLFAVYIVGKEVPGERFPLSALRVVSSRDDGFTNFGRDTRQLYRATPAKTDKLLIVPGGDHGTDLLPSARLRHAIDAFVHANAG